MREILDQYPQFVKDVILIIDYDTELQMSGLDEVIYGNLDNTLSEIMQALDNCGATYEADVLRRAKSMPQKQFEDEYDNLCNELSLRNNYEAFWDTVRNYINASLKS